MCVFTTFANKTIMYRQIVLNTIYDKESLTLTGAVGQNERYTVYIYIAIYIYIFIIWNYDMETKLTLAELLLATRSIRGIWSIFLHVTILIEETQIVVELLQ